MGRKTREERRATKEERTERVIRVLSKFVTSKIEVYIDGKKAHTFEDDKVWETTPKLAQEQAKGKDIKIIQKLEDGTEIDMTPGGNMDKLIGNIGLPPDDRRRLESKPFNNTMV